jgi:Na+/melibiose symporter-like transporter
MDLFLNETDPKSIAVYVAMLLWIILWKGLALWYASKRNSRAWFVLLLVVSTFGILEIVYLFFVLKLRPRDMLSRETRTEKGAEKKEGSTE